jgi:tryptophan synthase beta chain
VGRELGPDALLLVNLSGRGDKDVHTAATWFGLLEAPPEDEHAKGMGVQA